MTTTTPFIAGGAPLREVGEAPPRASRTASVVAVLLALFVLLPLATIVPPSAVLAAVGLWVVLRFGLRDGRALVVRSGA